MGTVRRKTEVTREDVASILSEFDATDYHGKFKERPFLIYSLSDMAKEIVALRRKIG